MTNGLFSDRYRIRKWYERAWMWRIVTEHRFKEREKVHFT